MRRLHEPPEGPQWPLGFPSHYNLGRGGKGRSWGGGSLVTFSLWKSCDWISARCHSQLHLQLLVNHIADADGGDDLEEVRCQASVEPSRALGLQDLPEKSTHFQMLLTCCSSCQKRNRQLSFKRQCTHNKYLPGEQKSYLALACGFGPEPEDNWQAARMCWTQCHRQVGRVCRGQRHWCCSCAGSSFSVSDGRKKKQVKSIQIRKWLLTVRSHGCRQLLTSYTAKSMPA